MAKNPKIKIEGPKAQDFIKSLGLLPKGNVQTFIDIEMVRLADPYVPSDIKSLRKSVFLNTDFGSGEIVYTGYYENMYEDTSKQWQGRPKRGARWVHRMLDNGGREKIMLGVKRLLARG